MIRKNVDRKIKQDENGAEEKRRKKVRRYIQIYIVVHTLHVLTYVFHAYSIKSAQVAVLARLFELASFRRHKLRRVAFSSARVNIAK